MTYINYKACGGSEAQTRAEEEKIKNCLESSKKCTRELHVIASASHISRSSNMACEERKYLNQKHQEHDCKHEIAQKGKRNDTDIERCDALK